MMQAARDMQGRMAAAQQELERITVTGTAGGGMVRIEMDGHGAVKRVHLDPSVVNPADIELLEDLVQAAHNEARQKAADASKQEMVKVTGGLDLPFKLPF